MPVRLNWSICLFVISCCLVFSVTHAMELKGQNSITDQAGRQIVVKKKFERIISLYAAHTENLFAMGASGCLIGVSKNCDYPPGVRHKTVFSYRDGPEKFLAVQPDLILIRPMIDRAYTRLVQQLEQYGITVVSLQPGNLEELEIYKAVKTGKVYLVDEAIVSRPTPRLIDGICTIGNLLYPEICLSTGGI